MLRTFSILSSVSLSLSLCVSDLQILFPSAYLLPLNDLRFSLCSDLLLLLLFLCLPGKGVRSGRILSLGSRFKKKFLVLFMICQQTSQWLHVIIALILSYGFVKISRCSACSVTVCVQAGIDSWFKFRFFIGCEGTSGSFFC
jgi:hypothetical protein